MLKKILIVAIMLFSIVNIVGCSAVNCVEASSMQEYFMTAEIIAINDKLEVDVIEGEYAYGIYWVITSDETKFYDKNNNEIYRNSLVVGDKIKIYYGGQVMMSYPPQIVAKSIYVVG